MNTRNDDPTETPHARADACILVKQIVPGTPLPSYAYPGDAGADLYSAEDVSIFAGQRKLIRTGIAIAIPTGYVGLIHPRSGLASLHGLTVLNAPGTIDAGYRGEVYVNLINHDPVRIVQLHNGDRIAQLVIQQVQQATFRVVNELPVSPRNGAGHASSGQ